jgi:hypothetical protein
MYEFTSTVEVMEPGCARYVYTVAASQAARMIQNGQAHVIAPRKESKVARRIELSARPETDDTGKLSKAHGVPTGTRYVFTQHLDTGHHTYTHKALPKAPEHSGQSLDGFLRSVFHRVQLDCLVGA